MLLYYQRTQKGRVVYKRKKKHFSFRDILRILFRVTIDDVTDLAQAAAALLRLEIMLEKASNVPPGAQNLAEYWPIWWNALEADKKAKWITEVNNLYPFETIELWIAHENWKTLSLIRETEELSTQELIASLTKENEALRKEVDRLSRLI